MITTLGDTITIASSGKIFYGILDRDYVEALEMSGFSPVITCLTEDVTGLVRGDLLKHGTDKYTFIFEEPDGTGVSRLILEDANAQS